MKSSETYLIAKQKLSHYCSYQERSKAEVLSKLQTYKDLSPAEAEQIVQELITENFLNEDRYISSFVHGKFSLKKWGKLKIYHTLVSKQINPQSIRQTLSHIPDEAYQQTIQDLIYKKLATLKAPINAVIQKKVVNYLLQKGYEHELIRENLQAILQQDNL
ncbi:MAG: regulatory protein RecX [Candidatus Amoebophilus sp.]